MKTTLEQFQDFLDDKDASTCYITGMAGTGKTTSLRELIEYCISENKNSVTCAYTHQAVKVLAGKIPYNTNNVLCTLHSYLKKRPSINGEATKLAHIDGNVQTALPEVIDILFVDEFSMIGEKDHEDINTLQYNEFGELITKVVYIGDVNQLPPVKDEFSIVPQEPYWIKLTKIHRQAGDNPIINTLIDLNAFINGERVSKLESHETFIRGQDIINLYKGSGKTKIMLAYTNAHVEVLNATIQGRGTPIPSDTLFSPTVRNIYTLQEIVDRRNVYEIINLNGEVVDIGDKYKTLDTVRNLPGVKFFELTNSEGEAEVRAAVFGHSSYNLIKQELGKKAVKANRAIEKQFKATPSTWSKANWQHTLAKERKEAWKNFLAFNTNVICLDFNHAMTIHKSQGSTFEEVFLDMEDIGKCADKDYKLYLKLLYVAISRASEKVYTN